MVVKVQSFSMEELKASTVRLKSGKAPDPDGVLPEIAKVTVRAHQRAFFTMANGSFSNGEFPNQIKKTKMMLVRYPCKEATTYKSVKYRPISFINCFCKIKILK